MPRIWQPGEHRGFGILGEPGTPNWFELHTRACDASAADPTGAVFRVIG